MQHNDHIEGFRPSLQQTAVWRHAPHATILLRAELPGSVAPERVRQALELLVARDEILRTRLHKVPGMQLPLQVIGETASLHWQTVDATAAGMAPAGADTLLADTLRAAAVAPDAPVLAAALVRLSPSCNRLLLAAPAANADEATLRLVLRQVAQACGAASAGGGDAAEPLQYADYAEWQHETLEAPESGPGRAFWQRQADAALLMARHPYDRRAAGAPAGPAPFTPARHAQTMPPRWHDGVLTAAAALGVSATAILSVCWAMLLQRQLGQSAVVLGWQHDGRNDATGNALGPYAKALPLLMRQDGARTLRELALAQDALLAQAHAWQDSHAPDTPLPWLFRHHTASHDGAWQAETAGDAALPFALALEAGAAQPDGTLALALQYDAAAFDQVAAVDLLGQFATLVEQACQGDAPLQEAGSLGVAQLALLQAVNRTAVDIPAPPLLHQLFEAQAARRPHATAAEFGGQAWTYEALNRRANRIAHRLRRAGVGPDQPVGLYLGRSLEALAGILGILKAGGAYLPLDPAYPAARLATMLEQTGAPVVLSAGHVTPRLQAENTTILLLDGAEEQQAWQEGDDADPPPVNLPEHLAYLIFTSGSTGQPKGVMVSHRNAVHSTTARWQNYTLQCESFLLSSSFSFDSSVAGLFWALSQGGRICLPADAEVQDAGAVATLIARYRATHALMLPSLYNLILETHAASLLASLRCVIVAGEACPAAVASRHHHACPQAQLYNEYGPTEGSVWATLYQSRFESHHGVPVLPIGQPIANMKVYVLDQRMSRVPPGTAGEIYIGGAGIVRGYLRRAGMTAERFIPDPFSAADGGAAGRRLYRTGDIGRFDAAGCLEFLGRVDQQVKIRGFRIELGEIEARLAAYPAVREAAVIARHDRNGDLQLAAYVVLHAASVPLQQLQPLLQQHLREDLPEHMVPAGFTVLDAMPLNPNGKLDRAALPEPQQRSQPAYVAPATAIEIQLAAIWQEVLGIEQVGLDDDFFALGGHSLVATRLVSRVRGATGRDVPVRAVFQHTQLRAFAAHVAQLDAQPAGAHAIPAAARDARLPLSFAQQRLWEFAQRHPASTAYHVPGAVRLRGALDRDALQRAFTELARRHEALRTAFPDDGAGPYQQIAPAATVPLALADLSRLDGAARDSALRNLLDAEAAAPFDLRRGPVLRAGLVALAADDHVLWLTLHHIVSDGWTMGVLVRELDSLYSAYRDGQPSPLPEPALHYADFAAWQRDPVRAAEWRGQLAYWQEQLAPPPAPHHRQQPRQPVPDHAGASHPFHLGAALRGRIDALCAREGTTLFMGLLAVFNLLLAAQSGQRDIRVGVPVAGRNRLELEPLAGLLTNTLVVRGDVAPDAAFIGLLRQVRATVLAAQANQDVPFEQVAQALQSGATGAPLFQAMFDVHRGSILGNARHRFGGMALDSVPAAPVRDAQYELMLDIAEQDDGLQAAFTYDTSMFDAATVAALARRFVALAEAAFASPDAAIAQLWQTSDQPMAPTCRAQEQD
jgi:amino acid adenylation domain-containing protein